MEGQRSLRPGLAIGGLLALVGVVAVAAAGRAPGAGESRPRAGAPDLLLDYIGTLALLFIPAGALLFVFAALVRKGEMARQDKRRSVVATPLVWVMVFLFAFGLSTVERRYGVLSRDDSGRPSIGTTATTPTSTTETATPESSDRAREGQVRWLAFIVLGSIVLAFVSAAGVIAWRRRYATLPERPPAEVLAEVLGETLDDLRREPDPRKAVIRAYARMERLLAARGFPREAFEAPLEYLARMLGIVQASAHSVSRLTRLFERARFSPHEIDADMKDDAIDALAGLRAELEAAR
jgi:hypothetical protein